MFLKQILSAALATAATIKINVSSYAYSQADVQVSLGDTVVWQFGADPHSVTQTTDGQSCSAMMNGFDSGVMTGPNEYSQVMTKPGNYYYYCKVANHCALGMRGVVRVNPMMTTMNSMPMPTMTMTMPMTMTMSTTTATSTMAPAATHVVQVAPSGSLTYSTPSLTIKQGDTVIWDFAGKPHTVTQTADGKSCIPIPNGFNSGTMLAPNRFQQTFDTVGKVWYVCTVANHCEMGMKGVIDVIPANGSQTTVSSSPFPTNSPIKQPSGSQSIKVSEVVFILILMMMV